MSAMSEPPPRELASLSVEELRAALGRQRAVNTKLRTVLATQAELHQAELAARDGLIAGLRSQVAVTDTRIVELRSQVVVLADRVAQLERQAGRGSAAWSSAQSFCDTIIFAGGARRFGNVCESFRNARQFGIDIVFADV